MNRRVSVLVHYGFLLSNEDMPFVTHSIALGQIGQVKISRLGDQFPADSYILVLPIGGTKYMPFARVGHIDSTSERTILCEFLQQVDRISRRATRCGTITLEFPAALELANL